MVCAAPYHAKMQRFINTDYQLFRAAFRGLPASRIGASCTNYLPCAGKSVSRAPAVVTFGCLSGDIMPRSACEDEPCAYPSHGPELKRWAFPVDISQVRKSVWFAESYLSSLGRAMAGTLPRGTSSRKSWRCRCSRSETLNSLEFFCDRGNKSGMICFAHR